MGVSNRELNASAIKDVRPNKIRVIVEATVHFRNMVWDIDGYGGCWLGMVYNLKSEK